MASQFHLADLFETVAATCPDRVAIRAASATLTYAELNDQSERLAAGLYAHGVRRGDNVGLYLTNSPAYLIGFIAAIKLGAVPFNVNYRYSTEELRYLFANAQSVAILHGAEFSPIIAALRDDIPTLRVTIAVDDGSGTECSGSLDFAQLLKTPYGGPYPRDENDIILSYTGGTTGMPKGVMWPHKAFLFACAGGAGYFNPAGPVIEPADIADRAANGYPLILLPLAPLMHGAAIWATWSALLNGLTILIDESRRFDAEQVFDLVERERANLIQFVGDAMAIPLRDALRANPGRWQLESVVNFGSGGAVFSQQVKDDLKALVPGASITDGMGSSETGISGMAEQSAEGMMCLTATEVQRVVIGDRFAEIGETGLIARSGNTPVGYYGDAVKTAETFRMIEGRLWAISGDAGRLDADARITMFGRGSTCINTGGEKVFPEEVEEALRAHPAILDAVVAGRSDPHWGEAVVGIVSLRSGTEQPDDQQIRDFLAPRLARYKIPKALVWVDTVERSPAGKQDYRWAKQVAA